MKKIVLLCVVSLFAFTVSGQLLEPVQWKFSSKKTGEKSYEVHLTAEMEYPWHIYSQYTEEGGPLPTTIVFKDSPAVKLKGKPGEKGDLIEKYEAVFMVDTRYYAGTVDFVQLVEVQKKGPATLEGSVTFMACTDEQCLVPQEVEFKIVLN